MTNSIKYNPEIERIRQELALEIKKNLPLAYAISTESEPWHVSVDSKGQITPSGAAKKSGVYIGASIESLSLSDLALLIDGKPNK
jgi:hypothetical protein